MDRHGSFYLPTSQFLLPWGWTPHFILISKIFPTLRTEKHTSFSDHRSEIDTILSDIIYIKIFIWTVQLKRREKTSFTELYMKKKRIEEEIGFRND